MIKQRWGLEWRVLSPSHYKLLGTDLDVEYDGRDWVLTLENGGAIKFGRLRDLAFDFATGLAWFAPDVVAAGSKLGRGIWPTN